ncbi:hypothetical protein JTE90_024683 [Oedothorax gibbosus]|uniref:Uncharacterized protein n=1 Tax=Oedothorax gibbosus TaxID=931172 RepID=A0AAV6TU14_9ARAC|nr:hypothetical protein JTE90_024683 [Oedothorax gibbosus]
MSATAPFSLAYRKTKFGGFNNCQRTETHFGLKIPHCVMSRTAKSLRTGFLVSKITVFPSLAKCECLADLTTVKDESSPWIENSSSLYLGRRSLKTVEVWAAVSPGSVSMSATAPYPPLLQNLNVCRLQQLLKDENLIEDSSSLLQICPQKLQYFNSSLGRRGTNLGCSASGNQFQVSNSTTLPSLTECECLDDSIPDKE